MPRKTSPTPFEVAYLHQFVGKTITSVSHIDTELGLLPCLNFSDGDFALIWCDPEGNGPGHPGLYDKNGTDIYPDVQPGS